jgi:iron(III) transport system substrate-binding protein
MAAACGAPAATPPAAAPAAPTAAVVQPTVPAAVPTVATASSGIAGSDWKTTWDQWLGAAREEGKVVVVGHTSESFRQAVTSFQKDYPDIQLEYTGLQGRDFFPKLFAERDGGQYLWDVRVGGPGSEGFASRDRGDLEPVRSVLLLPEVTDESKWIGGYGGLFDDNAKQYLLSFETYVAYGVYVNRDIVPESEFNRIEQLVDPKWKGKITAQDPKGSAGAAHFAVWLHLYGEQFLRDLYVKQEPVVITDNRQQAEAIIRGRYPIGIAVSDGQLEDFKKQGLGNNIKDIAEAGTVSTGNGGVQLFNRAPHPYAARIFINWLLTREVQERFSQLTQVNSRRTDVTPVDPRSAVDPQLAKTYVANQTEDFLATRNRGVALAKELFP